MIEFFTTFSFILTPLFYVYLAIVLIFIIMENRDASSTFSWMIVFVFFPVIGLIIYIFFGKNWRAKSNRKKDFKKNLDKEFRNAMRNFRKRETLLFEELLNKDYSKYSKFIKTIESFQESFLSRNNKIKILQNGNIKFPSLEKDLKKAKKYIHIEYFIWRDDELTNRVKDILIEKAKKGVEVRIMFDPAGSINFIFKGRAYRKELKKAGIKMVPFFNSMTRSKITALNNINHQKIVIIDGEIGYTGGMNMGQEYIDGKPNFKFWRDTHVKVSGDSVAALHSVFAYHWKEITKESLFTKKYFPKEETDKNKLPIQIITSGPESEDSYVRQLYVAMVNNAQKNVFIQSPYFIPDPTLFEALKLSALSGVKTKVMITGNADSKIAYWAAFSYFEELLRAGVEVYHYKKGFLHSKTVSIDSKICTIGSTNIDSRSFTTSYEVNAVVFDSKTTKKLENTFGKDLGDCKKLTLNSYKKINPLVKFRNSFFRLLSPLL